MNNLLPKIYIGLFLLIMTASFTIQAQDVRGLYVNDFLTIIGNPAAETQLLEFARDQGFNYLLLYNLYFIHSQKFDITDPVSAKPLADFMRRARRDYGVRSFGAVGESAKSFDRLKAFNQLYKDSEARFEVFNLEFEFWNTKMIDKYYCKTYLSQNQLPCDTAGAFQYYHDQLLKIKSKAQESGALTEVYIGKPTIGQCQIIGEICDRVLVHYYRKSPIYNNQNSIYNYHSYRLSALAPHHGTLDVMPIFGGGPKFMGDWLTNHPMEEAFDTYKDGKNAYYPKTESWKDKINLVGAQWYRYSDLITDHSNQELPAYKENPVILPRCISSQISIPKLESGTAHLQLFDLTGNRVLHITDTTHTHIKLNINGVATGTYHLLLEQAEAFKLYQVAIQRE